MVHTKIYKDANNNYYNLLKDLIDISITSLNEMYLPEKYLFATKKRLQHDKIIIEGESLRYSLINLIGLYKADSHGIKITLDLENILKHHINNSDKVKGIGEIGLLLWASALISPEQTLSILPKINFHNILKQFKDSKDNYTTELSWFLIGLLLASTFNIKFKELINDLPIKVYQKLRTNYGGKGIFRHTGKKSFKGFLGGHIGSFADQVYPIYAFSLYSQQMKNEEALLIANECAQKICEHQGEHGEWMWHYNANSGKVSGIYPIFSVHQDSMAPLALYAIQKASNTDFEKYIFKGLDWLEYENHLGINLVNRNFQSVWRSISPSNYHRKSKLLLNLLGLKTYKHFGNIDVLYESWSCHFGWILYAFAGRLESLKNKSQKDNLFKLDNDLKLINFNSN